MNKKYLSLCILMMLFIQTIWAQGNLGEEILRARAQVSQTEKVSPFSALKPGGDQVRAVESVPKEISEYTLVRFDPAAMKLKSKSTANLFSMEVPSYKGKSMELELQRFELFSENPEFREMPSGKVIDYRYQDVQTYRGIVKGQVGSLVSLTITEGELTAMISLPTMNGNVVIERLANREKSGSAEDTYIVYQDADVNKSKEFSCETLSPPKSTKYSDQDIKVEKAVSGCFGIFFDLGNSFYNTYGGGSTNRMAAVFAQVTTLYFNEGISMTMSGTNI